MTTFQLSIVVELAAAAAVVLEQQAAAPAVTLVQHTKQSCAGSLAEIGDTHENSDVVRQIDKPTTKKNKKKSFEHLYLVLGTEQNNA